MDSRKVIISELQQAAEVLDAFLNDSIQIEAIEKAASIIAKSINSGGKIISCGNGGSQSDAMHFAEELTGKFRENRRALPAMAISGPSYITCTANDFGFDFIFSRYVEAFGKKDDVLLAISTSGNSQNVLNAIDSAVMKGMSVIVLTGESGGKMKGLADVELNVPHSDYADRVQEIHIKIIHILILLIEDQVN